MNSPILDDNLKKSDMEPMYIIHYKSHAPSISKLCFGSSTHHVQYDSYDFAVRINPIPC